VAFASFFAAIDHLSGGHFFASGRPDSTQTYQYFSFTTLTTLGYGDFTAAGNFGRALANLEALTGQIFLVTLVAFLVARSVLPASSNADQPVPGGYPTAARTVSAGRGLPAQSGRHRRPVLVTAAARPQPRAGAPGTPHPWRHRFAPGAPASRAPGR
jgi:Ion channel